MIREIQGKIRARFEDSKEIPRAVDVIPNRVGPPVKRGDVVIVHDDKLRLNWRLAVVEDLIEGKDGLVRAAHIRMGKLKTTRPIVKLYPLEVTNVPTPQDITGDSKVSQFKSADKPETVQRVQRKAAVIAYMIC